MATTGMIPRVPVESSNIAAIGYAPEDLTLAVEFRNGAVRHLQGVPADLHQDFLDAPSKGKFFHQHIRGKFTALPPVEEERRTGACPACGDTGLIGCVCGDCGCSNYQQAFA